MKARFTFCLLLSICLSSFNSYAQTKTPAKPVPEWADPVTKVPDGFEYHLYPTPSRGPKTQASYLLLLPPTYNITNNFKYPVIYWLHGENGSQREGITFASKFDQAMTKGTMPEAIMVFVQGLPNVKYIDTKDGTRPVEKVIVKDLIKHIDATYRTISDRSGRALEGMSLGGYGALHLGLKYPELFSSISAIAPSISDLNDEPEEIKENFGGDPNYFNLNSPFTLARSQVDKIRNRTNIRIIVGDQDKFLPQISTYHKLLDSLKINHQFQIVAGAQHQFNQILNLAKFNPFTFWMEAWKK
jgi:endo-1,4-beta-xylanase